MSLIHISPVIKNLTEFFLRTHPAIRTRVSTLEYSCDGKQSSVKITRIIDNPKLIPSLIIGSRISLRQDKDQPLHKDTIRPVFTKLVEDDILYTPNGTDGHLDLCLRMAHTFINVGKIDYLKAKGDDEGFLLAGFIEECGGDADPIRHVVRYNPVAYLGMQSFVDSPPSLPEG